MRRLVLLLGLAIVVAACGTSTPDPSRATLPSADASSIRGIIEAPGQPVVLNIWASWCLPCRSEAPLFGAAHGAFSSDVAFIGVAVEDSPSGAADFLAEFGLTFDNYLDPNSSVPSELGGFGVPITYFFDRDGGLVHRHNGVIDERTLAINIDEILRTK